MTSLDLRKLADLPTLQARAGELTRLDVRGVEFATLPALFGGLAKLELLIFEHCTIEEFDPAAFRAGSDKGKVEVEFAYCTFDADALFERALVHGLGTWRVQDYGSAYRRDPRWKTLAVTGDDGLGDEDFRRAAYAFAGKDAVTGAAEPVHLRLLDHSKKPIREKVSLFLEASLPSPLASGAVGAGAKVWVLGAPVQFDKESLKARLEELGLEVTKAAKGADAVLVLPKPGPKLAQALASKLPVLVEGHLRAAATASAPAAVSHAEADSLDALLFGGDAKNQVLGLTLAKARALEGALLAQVVAVAFFASGADVRKEGRAILLTHAPEALRARLHGDKRNYFSLDDGAKLAKLAKELGGFGVDPAAFTMALLRLFAARPSPYGGTVEPALVAAFPHYVGREEELFEVLRDYEEIYLPVKKTFPRGLSRLRALRKLRVPHATVTSSANVAELATLPQSIAIEYWVKDTDLAHLLPAASNIHGLYFRGSYSNLSDITLLAQFPKLLWLGLEETGVSDLTPLAKHALTYLNINRAQVTSIEVLRGKTSLEGLHLQQFPGDMSPVSTLVNLEHLTLSFTGIKDLSLIAPLTKLVTLDLWGCKVTDLRPLAGKPLRSLSLSHMGVEPDLRPLMAIPSLTSLSLHGTGVDPTQLADLQAKLPDLYVSR